MTIDCHTVWTAASVLARLDGAFATDRRLPSPGPRSLEPSVADHCDAPLATLDLFSDEDDVDVENVKETEVDAM